MKILYAVLNTDAPYSIPLVFELLDEEWVESTADAYFDVPEDVYQYPADQSDQVVWCDDVQFEVTVSGKLGQAPTPQVARQVLAAYTDHYGTEGDGLVFVFQADDMHTSS